MSLLIGNPPGTEFLQKRSRCLSPPSTWHGIPAKAFQVSLPAVHLARNPRKSVPGGTSCRPPGTEFLQKRSRCHFLPSTWHGFPARVFQVSLPAVHLARNPRESVPGGISLSPTWHGNPAKACQVSLSASHLARKSRESVSGVLFRLPLGTESPRKRSRCLFPPSTWHGFPAKVFQVASTRCPPGTETLSRPEKCLPGSREYGRLIEWQAGCHLPRSLRTGRACADKLKDCNIVFSISFSYLCFRPEKIINRKDILTTSINPQSL